MTSHSRQGFSTLLEPEASRLSIAFVNNMPDPAFLSTEKQFLELVASGSGTLSVDVRKYFLTGVRQGQSAHRIPPDYKPIDDIWASPPDALIVTGSEPLTATLSDETYWDELARLIETSVGRTGSVLLSCLSAHAAMQLLDGVVRTPLAEKCTGVFPQKIVGTHPITEGIDEPLLLPHSRLNEVSVSSAERSGYQVIMRSNQHGWSVASKNVRGTELLLLQGHPEYSPSSLLREYRRDVERFIHGRRNQLPPLPTDCVAPVDRARLIALHGRLLEGYKEATLFDSLEFEQVAHRIEWPWKIAAIRFFTNWLALVQRQKELTNAR